MYYIYGISVPSLLIESTDSMIQDYDGNTALIEASQNGHVETAKVLLNHGANIHYRNGVRNNNINRAKNNANSII